MESGRRGKKYYYWNIQNSRKFRAHTESSINSSWIDFNRAAECHLSAQTAGITTQFIGLQLCCGDHLRIQKWLYAKQLQARKPGTLPHFGIYILSSSDLRVLTKRQTAPEQTEPKFQTKTAIWTSQRKPQPPRCCAGPRISWKLQLNFSYQHQRWNSPFCNVRQLPAGWVGGATNPRTRSRNQRFIRRWGKKQTTTTTNSPKGYQAKSPTTSRPPLHPRFRVLNLWAEVDAEARNY